jgi:formate dehydrogenase subunit gamma
MTKSMTKGRVRWTFIAALVVALTFVFAGQLAFDAPALAQTNPDALKESPVGGNVPGGALGNTSDPDFWRAIRRGTEGTVSIPDQKAARLVQSEGESWRAVRNGPLAVYGVWALLGTVIVLALFFLLRGRVKIDAGKSGRTITRFDNIERAGHWLLAVSFIVLALTGLNITYGRYVLKPVIGPDAFAAITQFGKLSHNFVGFAFIAGLVMVLVMWLLHNIPDRTDVVWLAKGGGLFSKHSHPPARKFNAGQKIIFWLVILGGASLALSGIALMFPFQFGMFADTFAILNVFGLGLPTDLTVVQEMQFSQIWHTAMAIFLTMVILAHIYIGTIGMEGAFDAMGSGEVDFNWAREHHSLWVEDLEKKSAANAASQPPAAPAE